MSRKLLFILAFLEGFSVLGIELSAHRMVAPAFGAHVEIWSATLAITTLALATGYFASMKVLKRKKVSVSFFLLAPAIWLLLFNLFKEQILYGLMSIPNYTVGSSLAILLYLFVPLLSLGVLPPLLVSRVTDEAAAGKKASDIFFFSTIGAVLGCYAFGFLLIPHAGVTMSLYAVGGLLAIGAVLVADIRKPAVYGASVLVLALIGVGIFTQQYDKKGVLYASEGLMGQVVVGDFHTDYNTGEQTDRIVFVNRMGQTWIDNENKQSRWQYVPFLISSLYNLPSESDILLLGLGGGVVANQLHDQRKFEVDAVDLDPRMKLVSREYLGLSPDVNVIIDDGRHYIKTTSKKYDAIVVDVFKGEVPPSHMFSLESFREIDQLLKPNGIVLVNFNGFINGEKGVVGRSLAYTMSSAGFFVDILSTGSTESERNNIFLASHKPGYFDNLKVLIGGHVQPLPSFFVRKEVYASGEKYIFRDATTLLEHLNVPLSQSWRRSYQLHFNKEFQRNEIPLVH